MNYREIRFEQDALGIVRLVLNRPERKNPIGPITLGELCHALQQVAADPGAHLVVLTGAGNAFCAGGDLGQMAGQAQPLADDIPPKTLVDLVTAFRQLGKPTLAAVNGLALGGGVGLVAACDLAIASDQAEFGTPEIDRGLWPMVISVLVERCIGRRKALELFLLGERIKA